MILFPIYSNSESQTLFLAKLKNANNGKVQWDFRLNNVSKIEIDYELLNGTNEVLFSNYGESGWIGIVNNQWITNAPTTANISLVNVSLNKREKVVISNINSILSNPITSYWDNTFSSDIKYYNIKVWDKTHKLVGDYYPSNNTNFLGTFYNKVTKSYLTVISPYLLAIEQ